MPADSDAIFARILFPFGEPAIPGGRVATTVATNPDKSHLTGLQRTIGLYRKPQQMQLRKLDVQITLQMDFNPAIV